MALGGPKGMSPTSSQFSSGKDLKVNGGARVRWRTPIQNKNPARLRIIFSFLPEQLLQDTSTPQWPSLYFQGPFTFHIPTLDTKLPEHESCWQPISRLQKPWYQPCRYYHRGLVFDQQHHGGWGRAVGSHNPQSKQNSHLLTFDVSAKKKSTLT